MTAPQTPDPARPGEAGERDAAYETASPGMPSWVPVLIGVVLVALAALAVFTGLRYRDSDTMAEHVQGRAEHPGASAPPGEPEAGASLVLHGSEGETTPEANAAVTGQARNVITGGPGGVESTMRLWARRGMQLEVTPPEAMVYVNGTLVGEANQFDTGDEIYDFAQPGSYTVKIVAPSGMAKTYIVTAATEAQQDVAHIKATLM